jgi:geranylgeranyl diphosphate synthase, type I
MTLEEFTHIFLPAIETELHACIDQVISTEPNELHRMLTYHLGWEGIDAGQEAQGKRIRPLLLLLVVSAVNGSWQDALPAAAAVELIHNFSLIHDDIQDNSPLRRNRPTVWVNWGIPQAINAGDSMFTLAQLAILKLNKSHSPQIALFAAQILNQACINLTIGQYLDLSYEGKSDLQLNNYWPMINGKTAALLSASAELGAAISDAPEVTRIAFREYGHNLGLAFQVQDDFLGIWGEENQLGKSTKSDLVSGKKTLPILFGIEKKGKFADMWRDHSILPDEVPEAVKLLTSEGAYDYTKILADQLIQTASHSLENIRTSGVNIAALEALSEFSHLLIHRKS